MSPEFALKCHYLMENAMKLIKCIPSQRVLVVYEV